MPNKIVHLVVVESMSHHGMVSLRGKKGLNDGAHKHLTEAGFNAGDEVVVMDKETFEWMLDLAKYGGGGNV